MAEPRGLQIRPSPPRPVGGPPPARITRTRRRLESTESAVLTESQRWWARMRTGRWVYERECFRNLLYYLGYQWLTFDAGSRQWRRQDLKPWVPRPVTNRFAPTLDVIRSALINAVPRFLVDPARLTDHVIAAARIANDFLQIGQADAQFRRAKREMASWLVLTGTALFGTEFSLSPEYGVVTVLGERCTNCGLILPPSRLPEDDAKTCPDCHVAGGLIEDASVAEDLPRGRLVTTAWSPFETFIDAATPDLDDQPALLLARSYHVETARRYWHDPAESIDAETNALPASTYLATVAAPMGGVGAGTGYERVLMRRLFLPPTDEYPDGLYGVTTAGGRLIDAQDYAAYRFEHSGRPYYPAVKMVYGQVPGRFWGKTPATDLAPKQAQRNRFESLFELITMTMASPVWMIPTGANPSKITGAPGVQVTATPVGGVMPQRMQGLGPDASLVAWIDKIDDDFEQIANVFAVMKGKGPGGGIRAAAALRQLEERGYGAFGQVFENLEEGYESWAVLYLEQFRAHADEPYVQLVMNAYGQWASREFRRTDLAPELNLRVESNSVRPKSSASRVDTIQRLVAIGALNPTYPEQKMRILEETGMLSLLPGLDADREHAMRENAQFLAWAKDLQLQLLQAPGPAEAQALFEQHPPPIEVNVLVDEHVGHFIWHRRFATTEDYRALPGPIRAWFEQRHLGGHLDAYRQVQALGGVPGGLSPVPFGAMPPPPGPSADARQPRRGGAGGGRAT